MLQSPVDFRLMLALTWSLSLHCSKTWPCQNLVFLQPNLTRRLCPYWKSICISVIFRYFNSFGVENKWYCSEIETKLLFRMWFVVEWWFLLFYDNTFWTPSHCFHCQNLFCLYNTFSLMFLYDPRMAKMAVVCHLHTAYPEASCTLHSLLVSVCWVTVTEMNLHDVPKEPATTSTLSWECLGQTLLGRRHWMNVLNELSGGGELFSRAGRGSTWQLRHGDCQPCRREMQRVSSAGWNASAATDRRGSSHCRPVHQRVSLPLISHHTRPLPYLFGLSARFTALEKHVSDACWNVVVTLSLTLMASQWISCLVL